MEQPQRTERIIAILVGVAVLIFGATVTFSAPNPSETVDPALHILEEAPGLSSFDAPLLDTDLLDTSLMDTSVFANSLLSDSIAHAMATSEGRPCETNSQCGGGLSCDNVLGECMLDECIDAHTACMDGGGESAVCNARYRSCHGNSSCRTSLSDFDRCTERAEGECSMELARCAEPIDSNVDNACATEFVSCLAQNTLGDGQEPFCQDQQRSCWGA